MPDSLLFPRVTAGANHSATSLPQIQNQGADWAAGPLRQNVQVPYGMTDRNLFHLDKFAVLNLINRKTNPLGVPLAVKLDLADRGLNVLGLQGFGNCSVIG